jgi:hypothetical protein
MASLHPLHVSFDTCMQFSRRLDASAATGGSLDNTIKFIQNNTPFKVRLLAFLEDNGSNTGLLLLWTLHFMDCHRVTNPPHLWDACVEHWPQVCLGSHRNTFMTQSANHKGEHHTEESFLTCIHAVMLMLTTLLHMTNFCNDLASGIRNPPNMAVAAYHWALLQLSKALPYLMTDLKPLTTAKEKHAFYMGSPRDWHLQFEGSNPSQGNPIEGKYLPTLRLSMIHYESLSQNKIAANNRKTSADT